PRWVLTAAHIAAYVKPATAAPRSVYLDGTPYLVDAVYIYPTWTDDDHPDDVALVKLASAVPKARTACLYPADDEVGRVATLAGRGLNGTGLTGPGKGLGTLRGSTVRIGGADMEGRRLFWDFHAASDMQVTPVDAISCPGLSGGPA